MSREFVPRPARTWVGCSAAHDSAVTKIRQMLGATTPSRKAWWAGLTPGERATLLRHAGMLTDANEKKLWDVFSCIEQDRILHAVSRAASWAKGLLA